MEFKLNKNEAKKAQSFLKKHCHPNVDKGAIGGHIKFIFTRTSIRDACTIKCTICDFEENITDYNSW